MLSGEQRTTSLNETTLITELKFATKTAERCESILNTLLIKYFPHALDSKSAPDSTSTTNQIFTGYYPTTASTNKVSASG
ncbi:hypothetical protein D030_3198 [Vibrio parahaemolyticus AQ3810]|nr:hypothetical protein D030_3198 [Vibrio parahaemolyticus AQ3810]